MRASRLKALAVVVTALAVVAPASANTHVTRVRQVKQASGKFKAGSIFTSAEVTFSIERIEVSTVKGPFRALPPPTGQDAEPQGAPQMRACVTVKQGTQKDYGCRLSGNASITLDPDLAEGFITFSVESEVHDGYLINVNVKLEGIGNPTPSTPGGTPGTAPITIDDTATLTREAIITGGFVFSQGFGYLGRQQSVDGSMTNGFAVTSTVDPDCFASSPAIGGCRP
ncbi:MAG TPA: hypothetical protein VGB83_11095 [Actinomycetota bacterium]